LYIPEIEGLEKIIVEKGNKEANLIEEILLVIKKVSIRGRDGMRDVSGATANGILEGLEKEGVWDWCFGVKFQRALDVLIKADILEVKVILDPSLNAKVFALEPKIYIP
jgi:hypothetical protein